ncbi:hypothetical protein LGM57_10635 [Burkholderia cepacia]|uniref:hypothetical protein n=1 Tax=Burkholderia cepacia TaxID=292 RepID=UPI001CF44F7F|nr:hypothetical protein [Burkholderia cepacia]MCA7976776.1 hypothetical protein [Burkholderia cepacia]
MTTDNSRADALTDTFRGNDAQLVSNIKALLELDADGALVPHGVGGHARTMLSAAAVRLAARPVEQHEAAPADTVPASLHKAVCEDFERAQSAIANYADVIQALQKALAYWMPKVFDERSAHDAYLLVGYEGSESACWGDQMVERVKIAEAQSAAPSAPLEGTGNGADERPAFDTRACAESLDSMITDWVESCLRMKLDWRGMTDVIERRLARFTARAPRTDVAGAASIAMETRDTKDARYFRWLCAHPDWHFIEALCQQFVAESQVEFYTKLSAEIEKRIKHGANKGKKRLPNGSLAFPEAVAAAPQSPSADAAAAPADAQAVEAVAWQRRNRAGNWHGAWANCTKSDYLAALDTPTEFDVRELYAAPPPPAPASAPIGMLDTLRQAREELSQVEWENDPPARVTDLFSTIDALLDGAKHE